MGLSHKQIEAVTAMPGEKRYQHFIKVVCDTEEAWSLYKDGWALAATDSGQAVFPLWPAKDYAALCAKGDWLGYSPEPIPLDDLMGELLPKLKADGVLPGVFYLPSDNGVTPNIETLKRDLGSELKKY